MNFQEKVVENTAGLRARAAAIADAAIITARSRASLAAKRLKNLKGSLAVLKMAGQDLNHVARRHLTRLVEENRAIAALAGKDLGALARSTYASLAKRGTTTRMARKKKTSRKRSANKAS